jgi:hypothetical protein
MDEAPWTERGPQPESLPAPTNPFKDDELQAPPSVPKDLGFRRSKAKLQPVEHRRPKYSAEPTVIAPVKVAEVAETERADAVDVEHAIEREIVVAPRPTRLVRQVNHEVPAKRVIPKNPLREE